jgi:S1-C subfamily serine protease
VLIAEVTAGSLAERSGLRGGDKLVTMAGTPVQQVPAVVRAIRQQPAGTWLPVQVSRDAEVIDLVVKFPPKP